MYENCPFQCYAFSRVKKCFVKGVLFQKRRIENPNIFQLLQQGVFEGNVGRGGVNMWTDVTLWLARADLEHVCSDMTGPLDRKICFDIYVEELNASFINQKC